MSERCGKWGWRVWGILAILGAIGVFQRFAFGHQLAAYGSLVPWGLWVAAYIYFVGLSAGAFLLSSLVYVFKVKALESIGRLALVTAVITLFMALVSIWFDIGHMERFWYVFLRPNFRSMMAWMIWMYTAYFLLLLVELRLAFQPGSLKRDRLLSLLGSVGVPLAIAFHGGVGALFAVVGARPYWHTGLFPILFLSGALTSGGALLLAVVALRWPEKDESHGRLVRLLSKITLGLLLFDLLLEWAEVSVPLWGGTAYHTEGLKLMLFGPFWWVFWIFHLFLGSLVPIWLLVRFPTDTQKAGWAGALIAVLFMSVRLNIVIPGLAVPILPGLDQAVLNPRLTASYVPSLHEWLVLAFVVALGLGMFGASRKFLNLYEKTAEAPR
ncbi:MAG: polysulfide reductase NrfD [Candidatus Omnitrophica bacterium]|nr:polysulfide reductase NrfD [Candidatus Omnitrophota bacterium]